MLQKGNKQWESKLKMEASKKTSGRRQFSALSGSRLGRWSGRRLFRSTVRQVADSSPHSSGCCHDWGVKMIQNVKTKIWELKMAYAIFNSQILVFTFCIIFTPQSWQQPLLCGELSATCLTVDRNRRRPDQRPSLDPDRALNCRLPLVFFDASIFSLLSHCLLPFCNILISLIYF